LGAFRRYFGAVSVLILLVVAALAFVNLQGTSPPPPAILDPDFTLWTQKGNFTQLMVWNLETNAAPGQLVLDRGMFGTRDALRLSLYQNTTTQHSVFVSLSESVDGSRLAVLMRSMLGIWVFKQACNCDSNPFSTPSSLLAVQVNDGVHEISFVFTEKAQGIVTFLAHRVVFLPTPSGLWTYKELSIAQEYALAGWPQPSALTFALFFEVGSTAFGWHTTYLSHITTIAPPLASLTSSAEIASYGSGWGYQIFKVRENLAMVE
jgi:hypothetical protein